MFRTVSLSLILLLVASPAIGYAASSYYVTFIPASPDINEPVTARVSSTAGPSCLPPPTSVTLTGNTIQLRLDYSDSCASGSLIASRDYAIGAYPLGRYYFDIQSCQNEPPPFGTTCTTAFHGPLFIGFKLVPVPLLSARSIWLLLVGIIGATFTLCSRRSSTSI